MHVHVQEQEYFKSILEKIEQSLLVVERDKRCAARSGFVQQTAVFMLHLEMYKLLAIVSYMLFSCIRNYA